MSTTLRSTFKRSPYLTAEEGNFFSSVCAMDPVVIARSIGRPINPRAMRDACGSSYSQAFYGQDSVQCLDFPQIVDV